MFETMFRRGDAVRPNSMDPAIDQLRGHFVRYCGDGASAIVEWNGIGQSSVPFVAIRHAPVAVVGPLPPKPPTRCPECGGSLTLDPEAIKGTPQADDKVVYRTARAAFCNFCEYVAEVPK